MALNFKKIMDWLLTIVLAVLLSYIRTYVARPAGSRVNPCSPPSGSVTI